MNAITRIADAFQVLIPVIAEQRREFMVKGLERLQERHGAFNGAEMRRLSSCWSNDGGLYRQLRSFLKFESEGGIHRPGDPMVIDHDRIAKVVAKDAVLEVESFVCKLEGKLGDLDTAELVWASGPRFTIRGSKAEHSVVVEQDIIVNVSSRGKLFNQFPARIRVDGKPISEKKFKEWVAAL